MDDEKKRIIKDQKKSFLSLLAQAQGKLSFFWVCLAIILGVTQGLSGI
ncbi:Uncharacterised protein [Enterobacter asburiae]|uniref:Uncharacterized protein n=1 Tax=Enterobacter asburiae TaxID=61645 RepID=A0A376FIQ4_ENTAS|nr:Uncharacterised protein [Enterobacter asburiae]